MSKVPMTVRGHELLEAELKRLKYEDRPRVIEAIAEARGHGDLKENAEYHAAREQQGFIEGRIKDIEAKLSNATIIDVTQLEQSGKVVFGVTVDVADEVGFAVAVAGAPPIAIIPFIETEKEAAAKRRRKWIAVCAAILFVFGAVAVVHWFVRPLDIVVYQALLRFELIQPGGG